MTFRKRFSITKTRSQGVIMRLGFLNIVTVLLMSQVGVSFSNAQSQGQSLPSRALLSRYNLEIEWATNAILNPTRDKVDNLVLDEETVYIQTRNGFVTALNSQTGQRRWAQIFGRIDTPQLPVSSNDNVVVITAGTKLYGVDKWTGVQLFELTLPQAVGTAPAMDESRIYVGAVSGGMYAIDVAKVYSLYQENLLPQWSKQALVWRHMTSKPIRHRPLLHGNQLTFASRTGTMYSVEAENDRLVYQMETREPVSAPIVLHRDSILVATEAQRLYSLDAAKGTVRWTFVARDTVTLQPYVIDDFVYLSPNEGTLYCLNADTGRLLWSESEAVQLIGKTPSYVVSADRLGNLLLLDASEVSAASPTADEELVSLVPALKEYNVELTGRLNLKQYSIRATNDLTDRIYLATTAGQVICLKERGEGYPRYFQNPDKRPIDPIFYDESMAETEPASETE